MKKTKIDHYTDKEALEFHSHKRPGKIEIVASKNMTTKRDLALAYSPGVAVPVKKISENPDAVYDYTSKGNLVALDTTKNLINKIQTKIVTFTISIKNKIDKIPLKSLKIISQIEDKLTISYEKNNLRIDEIISYFSKKNISILDISTDDADIEDVYINLTKN